MTIPSFVSLGNLFLGVWQGMRQIFVGSRTDESVRETIEELIEEREEAEVPIDAHEKLLLANILGLHDRKACDVMIPRANIVGLDINSSQDEMIRIVQETGHSRYPIYHGGIDEPVGLVHIQDALIAIGSGAPFSLQKLIRRVLFVAPSIRVPDLLLEMRMKQTHMALVVDEYGGIDGLVTIEDLVEEIVGDIRDEHDRHIDPCYITSDDGSIEVDARMSLLELEEKTGHSFRSEETEDFDTLGGLVFFLAGRVPNRGELITDKTGIEFEILDADPRRIKRLRLHNFPARPDTE